MNGTFMKKIWLVRLKLTAENEKARVEHEKEKNVRSEEALKKLVESREKRRRVSIQTSKVVKSQ